MSFIYMEPTVFHGFDNIATASVVAPFLIHGQVVVARFPYGKVLAYLLLGSLPSTPSYPLFSCVRKVHPLTNRVS